MEITDTYRKDGIKIAIVSWVKEIDKVEKLADCLGNFGAHVVEVEMDSGGEYQCMDGIHVCIKVWFLCNR